MGGLKTCWMVLLVVSLAGATWAEDKPFTNARSAGMGGAGVAYGGSAASMVENPATLVLLSWPEVELGYSQTDLGQPRQAGGFGALPLVGRLTVGLGAASLQSDEEGNGEDYFLSLAFPLSRNGQLAAGFNAKWLSRPLPGGSGKATGAGIDIGLLYQAWQEQDGRGLAFGAALSDLQTTVRRGDQEIRLPLLARLGAMVQLNDADVLAAAFEGQSSDSPSFETFRIFRVGYEHGQTLGETLRLFLRGGYLQHVGESGSLSLGAGLAWNEWRLDYAAQLPLTFYNSRHHLAISWGYQRPLSGRVQQIEEAAESAPQTKTALPTPEPDRIFSALAEAAEIQEFSAFSTPTPEATPSPTPTPWRSGNEGSAEEAATYHLPIPEGPAGSERSGFGSSPEMPAFFSGALSGGRGDVRIEEQSLRLHVVVNPFSPNGDGRQDRTVFVGRLVDERLPVDRWLLTISRSGGDVVRFFRGGATLPRNLEWDGTDQRDKRLADGDYVAVLRAMDENGMELASANQVVTLRTTSQSVGMQGPGRVLLGTETSGKTVEFTVPELRGSSDWRFNLLHASGKTIYSSNGNARVPEKITWQPLKSGKVPPAGEYTARLTYLDEVGLRAETRVEFEVAYPTLKLELSANPEQFVPRERGTTCVTFTPALESGVAIRSWELSITSTEDKREVRSLGGKGNLPPTLAWDGFLTNGQPAKSGGVYQALLTVTTAAGTQAAVKSGKMQCDIGEVTSQKALAMNLVHVRFPANSSERSAEGEQALAQAAQTLSRYPTNYLLQIIGHCSPQENADQLLELSRSRAQTVADYLIQKQGLPADKIRVIGRGASQPLSRDEGEAAQAKNRRVEVVLFAQ
jgi:outer membrane protein OmpA-like peptidoglycan-associated protein